MCDMTREVRNEWHTCVCGDEDNDNDNDQKVQKNMIIWKVQSCRESWNQVECDAFNTIN